MSEQLEYLLRPFIKWVKLKFRLHTDAGSVSYKVREVWWMSIGVNIGSEQNGKNENFERPVLVVRKFGQRVFFGVPMTSKDKVAPHRLKFKYKTYYKNELSELRYDNKDGILILNQMRAMSNQRLIRKAGVISESDFKVVIQSIKDLF